MRELIDFSEPVALLLIAIMHFVTDEEAPGHIIAAFRDAMAPGSYLALSHGTTDFTDQAVTDAAAAVYSKATAPLVLRNHRQVVAFFDGWELIEPGLVQLPLWRPDAGSKLPRPRDLAKIGIYGGAGWLHG